MKKKAPAAGGAAAPPAGMGKHILTEQKNIKFFKKYLINIFQSPLYKTRTKHYCSVRIMNYLPS